MTLPDIETLRICSVLNALACGSIFFILWICRRAEIHLAYWAASSFLYCATLLGLAWIGHAGLAGSSVLFALLAISNLIPILGLRRFEGRPQFESWMVLPVAFAVAGHAVTALLVDAGLLAARYGEAGDALGLAGAMLTSGLVMLNGPARGQRIAGFAMLGYLPGFAIVMLTPILGDYQAPIAMVPMLADMLLLPVLNVGLLAIPLDRAQENLRQAALRDPLTGAWNRAGLDEQKALLWRPEAGVIAIDVDHFKSVNDRQGHAAGDAVLVEIAQAAMKVCGALGGALARVGGDEFVILLPRAQDLRPAAATLMARVEPAQTQSTWSLSMGLGTIKRDEADFQGALRRADEALYDAKAKGRNRLAA
ncbi:GGDEF domain-containing protein [Novosphingobium sp. JCM 18896]|uniref:GGDEF domain-containing protein n=1 Tax=Novosphingobium sp. JCM 18896 TaxID=2989731 RepID=UPI00222172F3|nr:GGDEF domain-containing protein [Novosphingobium sp. JCM 18896]MCW1430234.1 GGDEF domain-containing protein [Novosphingobium sp. JCM 18896]